MKRNIAMYFVLLSFQMMAQKNELNLDSIPPFYATNVEKSVVKNQLYNEFKSKIVNWNLLVDFQNSRNLNDVFEVKYCFTSKSRNLYFGQVNFNLSNQVAQFVIDKKKVFIISYGTDTGFYCDNKLLSKVLRKKELNIGDRQLIFRICFFPSSYKINDVSSDGELKFEAEQKFNCLNYFVSYSLDKANLIILNKEKEVEDIFRLNDFINGFLLSSSNRKIKFSSNWGSVCTFHQLGCSCTAAKTKPNLNN